MKEKQNLKDSAGKLIDDLDAEFSDCMHAFVPEVEPDYDDVELDETPEVVYMIPPERPVDFTVADSWPKDVQKKVMFGFDPVATSETSQPSLPFPGLIDELLEVSKYYGSQILEEKSPVIQGQDILTIRALTGKKRDNAIQALYASTVEMMDKASPDCFYVPGNVASSKNSKNIVTVRSKNKIDKKTGKPMEFSTLVPSDLVRKYKQNTRGYWLRDKVAFLNQTRHLPLPIKIEFTFIRESLRAFDYINATQILADIFTEFGWLPDDETVYLWPVYNHVYYHNKLAGVLIRIIK